MPVRCADIVVSGDVGVMPPVPRCTQTTVSESSHAAQKGSQWSVKSDGNPRLYGLAEKVTECTPFAATLRTSAAINSGSHIGVMASGMNRSGYCPHHVSMCQSLYARTMTSDSSGYFSAVSVKRNPVKRT